jgi:hypothetical protein
MAKRIGLAYESFSRSVIEADIAEYKKEKNSRDITE